MANNSDTESTLAQGIPESPNPLTTALKPPLRLERASFPVSLLVESPVPGRLILTFVIKSSEKVSRKWELMTECKKVTIIKTVNN